MPVPTIVRYFKKMAVLFRREAVYGTDPALVSADWFEAQNATITP